MTMTTAIVMKADYSVEEDAVDESFYFVVADEDGFDFHSDYSVDSDLR